MVPLLVDIRGRSPVRRLNPTFMFEGKRLVVYSQLLSAVLENQLEIPRGNLRQHHDDIVAALDMVFYGF